MSYDYSKLKGKIVEVCGSQSAFAKAMDWSDRTTTAKLNSKVYWKQPEICKALDILGIDYKHIQIYFFKEKVQNN